MENDKPGSVLKEADKIIIKNINLLNMKEDRKVKVKGICWHILTK